MYTRRSICLFAVFLALSQTALAGQSHEWRLSVLGGGVASDGHFSATRGNGKVVTSDIDNGLYLTAAVERRVSSKLALSVGYETTRGRTYRVDQDFPDQTSFSSSDTFDYHAVLAGVAFTLISRPWGSIRAEPSLSWGWVTDFSLESAAPPFDRSVPLAVDAGGQLGVGGSVSGVLDLGESGLGLLGRGGLTIQRVVGDFPADPALPGSEGSVSTQFNPLHFALGITYRW